ncbi:hypothetical protein WG78_17375 [Amantichitinum ursilacus]|uniref:Glycosyltransferase 2-like domain-containing protein n=2 Tax=Amantichitinum ursilacus TaxID=857265 RepID=A0A0N0XGS5_9NEIS|nr:hypothetical protein WG78_17375 [Amantichitinum ursilacus]
MQEKLITEVANAIAPLVSDYELIIVDNASTDDSVGSLKRLTSESGLPNLQVYALTKEVDLATAAWVGLENALGDYVAVINPLLDDIHFLPNMLEHAVTGADVVFANNEQKPAENMTYRAAHTAFNGIYKYFNGLDLVKEAPQYRLLSKRVVNFILQHPQPGISYRHLPATGGFAKARLSYSSAPKLQRLNHAGGSFDRGMRLLVATTRAPMRFVTALSLFGAFANIIYSLYVVAIGLFKSNVAPGWVSLSLQQSGMFFLISLVLLVLGEYILNMVSVANEGPLYHVGQEFTSARMTRREKLNIEEVAAKPATAGFTTTGAAV